MKNLAKFEENKYVYLPYCLFGIGNGAISLISLRKSSTVAFIIESIHSVTVVTHKYKN